MDFTKKDKVVAELRSKRVERDAAWYAARDRMLEIMKKGLPLGAGPLTEEDKYGDAVL